MKNTFKLLLIGAALFLILPELQDKLKKNGVRTPKLEMKITGVQKEANDAICIVGLILLGIVVLKTKD